MRFRVLGPVEVVDDGRPQDIGSARRRALLARLLVDANRVVPLDRLIEDLWAGEPPAAATATLQAHVSHLRRLLEPDRPPRAPATVVVTRPPGYCLVVAPDHVDATVFEDQIRQGRELLAAGRPADAEACFDAALALWRGEPYADVEPGEVGAVERRRLGELRASAREDRIAALVAGGRHRYAIADLEVFLEEHPYRERAWELLVLARYRSGRQVDALRAYQDARRVLVDEVGIEPGAGLVELERLVVAQDASLEWRPGEAPTDGDRGDQGDTGAPGAGGRAVDDPEGPPPAPSQGSFAAPSAGLIGREEPLARLAAAAERLRRGRGGLVVVSGDAGIGKTRLVEEALGGEGAAGTAVAWGRTGDGEGTPAFWPWTQVLGRLVDDADPMLLHQAGPALVHLVPELRALLGPPPETAEDNAAVRFAVQRAVQVLLGGLAPGRPAVLVFDDLHWADPSSLRLLTGLAPELAELPALVVATVRPQEGQGNAALTDLLALAARSAGAERIELAGLGASDVAAHLAASGLPATGRLVEVVTARSGGNPFFLTELVQLLASEGTASLSEQAAQRVPHGVRDVVQQRLVRLPEGSRDLLVLAAVAGRTFDLSVLALAADVDVESVLDRLESALLIGLVVCDDDLVLEPRFSHDLVRDAVYGALSPLRRARLHRRIAEALADRAVGQADPPASQIAHHFAAALSLGTGEAGRDWARRAAEQAIRRAAPSAAAEAWQVALTCHDAAFPDDADTRFDLLLGLATAHRAAWDLDSARTTLDAALAIAVAADDPMRIAAAAALYGGVNLWTWRQVGTVDDRTVDLLADALDRLVDADAITRSRALGALGVELYYGPDHARAEAVTAESVRLAEPVGGEELARALNNAFVVRWRAGRDDELLDLAERLLAIPDLRPDTEAVGVMHRTMLLLAAARLDDAAASMARARELRPLVRTPEVAAQLDFTLATWAAMGGDVDGALELVQRGWRSRYEDSTMWGGEWVYLLARLSLHRPAAGTTDRLAELARLEPFDLVRPTAVLVLLQDGRRQEAIELVGEGPRTTDCWVTVFNDVQWALVACELDLPVAAELRARLLPHADGLIVGGSNLVCWGSMHWVLARLAELLGDADAARVHWAVADRVHAEVGLPPAPRRAEGLLPRYPDRR
jgi:DNA-binding SARP family transcriptional activator